ncbi:hypothetical protein MBLNU459_g0024t1 [Dothideomycetes sp. NU459]
MQKPTTTMYRLPPDILESQLSLVDLLIAMFPDPSELDASPETLHCIDKLRESLVDESAILSAVPADLSLAVHVRVDAARSVQLNIQVPLQAREPQPLEPPPPSFSLRQPNWLARAQLAELAAGLPDDDVFAAIEHVRDEAQRLLSRRASTAAATAGTVSGSGARAETGPLVRVWFYFPSLSTREKRADMVAYAASYSLTGFVLAGKPGVLCLEGTSAAIDAYMKEIKSVSWGDIPSHQKKVSERYREEGGATSTASAAGVTRVFDDMIEITDLIGRHGERANRGDMAALQAWLAERGLGAAFEQVIFQ